jgi:hypothetical protein
LKHFPEGLISPLFLNKILEFNYIFDLHIAKSTKGYKELAQNFSELLFDYLKISFDKKREDIIIEYVSYLIREETKNNIYLFYKLLKLLYFCNPGEKLIFYTSNKIIGFPNFNFNVFFLNTIEILELKYIEAKQTITSKEYLSINYKI